ncbi:UNVERIFIED_CONTAM: E3 ubiquitin-protein ligase RGLG1 [Sesamum angustifolium]|uniref:E3 ubiquitin-protein ligase RGLG1 n=1 Tax=Sesamum angustifolium TaxID=2727405 RepID=A0AAW2MB34_9LAMI
MGNRSSSPRRFSSFSSSSFDHHDHGYSHPSYSSTPHHPYSTPTHHQVPVAYNYAPPTPQPRRRLDRKFSRIADNYQTLDQVTAALSRSGLESSNLIVGIDFTKSNEWTASTHDQDVFSFFPDGRFCEGFEEVLRRYRELVPQLRLSGPTSFAPVIEMAMSIVEESGGQYHVLLIIADGQEFDDNIPARAFDNFQFVNFTEIMSKNVDHSRKEAEFALSALMEIPSQYQATLELNILGHQSGNAPSRAALPPPIGRGNSSGRHRPYSSSSFQRNVPLYPEYETTSQTASSSSSLYDRKVCPICLSNSKDMAFGCGHQDYRMEPKRKSRTSSMIRQVTARKETGAPNDQPANTWIPLLVMSFPEDEYVDSIPSLTTNEDFLTREILLTHNPDDRQLDSDMLLQLVESTFCSATENVIGLQSGACFHEFCNRVFAAKLDVIRTGNIDLVGSEEPISLTISKISNEMLSGCFEGENLHRKTLILLEMLSHYRWDAKVVLALASLACSFGLFQLILQLQSDNALAGSLAMIKRVPRASSMLNPEFKALNLLVNTMVKLTKVIISFEGMSMQHELVDDKSMDVTKPNIYMATYWILRSILLCSSQIADLRNLRLEKVHWNCCSVLVRCINCLFRYSDKTVVAAWGLHSVGNKLSSLCIDLGEHVAKCQQQIETRFYDKLLQMFKEKHVDNQEVLSTLFPLQSEYPFKNSSSAECGIFELKNKVVVLLISKPELILVDELFFLVQQTSDHPQRNKFECSYEILWVPIPSSREWSLADKINFEFFSDRLPWFSIRRPWSLNSTVVSYIRQEWNFNDDPIMVVLNENGMVTNLNAMDMVWIWGPKAFPFSNSREKELWEQENCMLDLIINGISPSLTQWVEEGKNICIYGSSDIHWIREFNASIKKIKSAGIQLEVVYVGCKNPDENVTTIIDTIDQEKICTSLTFHKVQFFWLRLERIKRLISAYQDHMTSSDKTSKELEEFLDFNRNENWAIIGQGSSTDVLKLDAEKLKECLDLLPLWCKNVTTMGLVGAIKSGCEPSSAGGTCNHSELFPYEEGLVNKTVICGSCKSPMEKFVLYKCEE